MKKKIRSYLVFASTGYRIWGLVVIPALLFAATYFIFSDIAEITSVGVFAAVCYGKSHKLEAFCAGLLIYLIAVGTLNITRYMPGVIQHMMDTFLATLFFSVYGAGTHGMHGGILELIILIVSAIAVSIVTVWHVLWRMKRSYYEKESEKGN